MIQKEETEIIGNWIFENGVNHEDSNCSRIRDLISNYLTKIAESESGWEKLFRDNSANRYWELTYLQSSLHGGGPQSLIAISKDNAESKYNVIL